MKDYRIISISGKSGLFKLLTSTKSGIVAESLIDGRRTMVQFTMISAIDEIAIYTYDEELPLWKVFKLLGEKENFKKASISPKSSKEELIDYFREVLPEFDDERVYPSHIKKIIQWYNLLQDKKILKDFLDKRQKEEDEYNKNENK